MRTMRLMVGALLWAAPLAAQVPAAATEMLQRLYASRDFAPERLWPPRWTDGGAAYTTVEPSVARRGGFDIVRYVTATGERSVLVSTQQLVPTGATTPLSIDNYAWSADGTKLLVFTNTERVWRTNSRGDYWVLDRPTGALRQLGKGGPPSTMMYAKFSPAGDRVAYVRKGDIYVERLQTGVTTRLTTGADSLHVNGMTDWVYEEEFGLADGFRWSPDGTRIAYWNFDMTGVGTFTLINDTDSLYPITIPIQYPKAGTTNSAVRVGIISATGGRTTWIALPGDLRDDYVPWMEWAGAGEVMIQRINRRQDTDRVMFADAATGVTRTALVEHDSAWVDVVGNVTWIGGDRFLWESERDGWRHLYSVSRDGRDVKLVTRGEFDVMAIASVDDKGGWLYVTASPENATQRYLYRVRLGGGTPERISPAGVAGTHGYNISPDAKWAIHTYSTFDTPPVTDLVGLPDHRVARTLATNAALKATVASIVRQPVEFFRANVGDGVTLDGWMIKPPDFDSTKTYPMLMHVYGEPASQTVRDAWGGTQMLWHRMIAAQGYIVASVDNRGTPAPRGRAWRKVVYGAIGVISSREQSEAVQWLARSRRYVDSTRVAIWGWSGGGSSTLQAMFRYPDVYQVGMAVASVPDQRLYDNIYQERYSGVLPQMAAAYAAASPISQAAGLKGKLLIVHGSGDDNVHYQGDERLANKLVELGKAFDFMVYPNRSHCICEGRGTTLHVYSLLTRYLTEHLKAGGVARREDVRP